MIARLWHGYTAPENADAYEQLLKKKILPGIHRISGYQGASLLRRNTDAEVEFITLTMWDSMEAIRQFAGGDRSHAVVPPEARRLLVRFDQESVHYDAVWCP